MTTPAHSRHARIMAAVERHHANAQASYQGGAPFGVLLRRGQSAIFGGMGDIADAPALTCSLQLHHCPDLKEGSTLEINGIPHRVCTAVQANESGWVTVGLFV